METLEGYISALASSQPAPGGGSAATVVAALAAALVAMVARITAANPAYAGRAERAESLVVQSDRLRAQLLLARTRDEAAYLAVVAAQARPRATPLEKAARSSAIQDALALAASEPLGAAGLAYDAMRLTSQALELENRHLASDLGCAAEFAAAALAASAYNVRVNHAYLRDLDTVRAQELQLAQLEARAATELAAIRQALRPAP